MNPSLGQWMTPEWVAQELVGTYFRHLSMFDSVIEPSCGTGAFLSALPDYVPAIGVEIDPALAAIAIESTGRQIIVGDFTQVELPRATAIIGNPPFKLSAVTAFLQRAFELLPDDGQVGFILPAHTFQTAATTVRMAERWHIEQVAIPRNVFPRISMPCCFARFTKGKRGLIGFALFHEVHAVNRLQRRYRALLAQGERSAWSAVTRAAVEQLGGEATLAEIYREVEGHRPTQNTFWREKVRQQLQRLAVRVAPGIWRIDEPEALAA